MGNNIDVDTTVNARNNLSVNGKTQFCHQSLIYQ